MWVFFPFVKYSPFSSRTQTQHDGPQELVRDQVAVFCPFPLLLWSKMTRGRGDERAVEFSAAKGHLKHLCTGIKLTCKSLLTEICGTYRGLSAGIWPAGKRMDHYSLEHHLFHHQGWMPGGGTESYTRFLYVNAVVTMFPFCQCLFFGTCFSVFHFTSVFHLYPL